MKTIWKFELRSTDIQTLKVPKGYKVLTLQLQRGIPYIWIECDPNNDSTYLKLRTYGTGHEITNEESERLSYVGTYLIHQDSIVLHVYQQTKD